MDVAGLRASLAAGFSLPSALAGQGAISCETAAAQRRSAQAELRGAGEFLQRFLDAPEVSDVVVHGGAAWVDCGQGLEFAETIPGGEREVRALAVRLAALAGRRLDDAAPIVDGVLPSGVRLHAVIPPLSADGTSISLRTHRQHELDLAALQGAGSLGPLTDWAVRTLIKRRANGVIAGATSSGKTTLLAALLGLAGARERIVVIEEAHELRPCHPHVAHLQSRGANVQAAGEVPLSELVRAALRMRPDRIVLGEARGGEIRDVLAALNTGHAGSWFTLHASSAARVPARLVALGALAGMAPDTVAIQAAAALDVLIFLRHRQVAEIAELRAEGGELRVVPVLTSRRGAGGSQEAVAEEPVGGRWEEFCARWEP